MLSVLGVRSAGGKGEVKIDCLEAMRRDCSEGRTGRGGGPEGDMGN